MFNKVDKWGRDLLIRGRGIWELLYKEKRGIVDWVKDELKGEYILRIDRNGRDECVGR